MQLSTSNSSSFAPLNGTFTNTNNMTKEKSSNPKKSSPARIRKPAPDLLISETSTPSLTLSLSLDNHRRCTNNESKQQEEDPLGHPAAVRPSPKLTHDNSKARPTRVEMTEQQFWEGLHRFGAEDEDEQHQSQPPPTALCPRPTTTTTATTPSPVSNHSIIVGAIACLCSATLGAGILSLPYAMAEAGMICGMTMLIASALATSWSIQLLVQAMQVVYYSSSSNNNNNLNSQEKTYEHLVQVCLGNSWRRLAEASMMIFCCGAAVAYVIAVGDILQQSGWASHAASSRALAMTLVWGVAMVPLSLLRTMKSLECASSIGIASIMTLVMAALYHYLEHPGDQAPVSMLKDPHQSIFEPTQGALSILRACPIILFAFSCQVNVCAIYDEMPATLGQQQSASETNEADPTLDSEAQLPFNTITTTDQSSNSTLTCSKYHRMNTVTWCAVGICALLYSSISIIALLDFGSAKMTPNILSSYNPESVMQVAFIGMALAVVLAYPMNIFPARVTLLGIVRTISWRRQQTTPPSDLVEPLLAGDAAAPEETNGPLENPDSIGRSQHGSIGTLVEHVLATLFLTGLSLGLAIVAPNISVVFGLLGGTSSSVLGFVIPGFLGYVTSNDFYQVTSEGNILGESAAMESNRRAATRTRILSLLLVVAGVLVGIVTTAVTVHSTFAS